MAERLKNALAKNEPRVSKVCLSIGIPPKTLASALWTQKQTLPKSQNQPTEC